MIDGNIDVVELNGDLIDYVSIEGELLPIGPKGDKGDPGDPGFSPQVDITKIGNATTLTIVDQQGTHQSVIYDGTGDMNKSVYDTDNDGIVDNAERVNNHTVLSDVPADAQFTDTTYSAGVGIEITAGNVINNTQTSAEWGNISGDLEDQTDLQTALNSKADLGDIPDSTSDLTNDSGFITNAVNDLVNYYLKSETYTKTEVNNLISQIPGFAIQVVQTLPVSDIDPHTIYLVPKTGTTNDVYDEYIYVNNAWEMIGNTQIDLTNYVQFSNYASSNASGVIKTGNGLNVDSNGVASAGYYDPTSYAQAADTIFVSKATLEQVLPNKYYEIQSNKVNTIDSYSTNAWYPSAKCVYDNLATKQDTLVSGTNIKTINNTSLLGSGNITINADDEIAISTTQPTGNETLWINPSNETNQAKYYYNNVWNDLSIKALDGMPIGSIMLWPGTASTIPTGWLLCDGTSLSEEEYPELYDVIGNIYGGSGTSFNLPDYRDRTPVGYDANDDIFNQLGKKYGSKELQRHSHQQCRGYQTAGFETAYSGQMAGWGLVDNTTSGVVINNITEAGTGDSGNIQPSIVQNFIIKATNTTPTMASIVNTKNNSTEDAYSCDYVNDINSYSTTEIDTGKRWIDGKPIYRKVIDCGAMPNATTKQVPSGLTNVFITQIYGIAYNSASTLVLPDVNPSGVQYSLRLFYTYESDAVGITTSADRSGYNGYVILEYIKTTD